MSKDLKVRVQSFGRFLSGMVMPNIGAFIAWGLITALFIPTGWMPNESLSGMVGPMITYMLPLLIGYCGGKQVAGDRGAIVGAITTFGVITGTNIPMFIGAMIAGPTGGYVIKKFDEMFASKVKSGFEMLFNNFSAGIIGMLLSILFFKTIGPVVVQLNGILESGVKGLVDAGLLPLTSIIVEPAKILFLNNAINHGVFSPLGIKQASEFGKSIFFLIESNPGPGLGILLAYMMVGKGRMKASAPGAAIIHFFGGIHEIYFPYVLAKPALILAAIGGGMTGVFVNLLFNAGLVAPPSPGSIFAILALVSKGSFVGVIAAVTAATVVSFLIASAILKGSKDIEEEEVTTTTTSDAPKSFGKVSKIVVACDAGMGSSAMGASVLRKKVVAKGLNIHVENRSISNLTEDIDIVITHTDLSSRAKSTVSSPIHLSIDNFMNHGFYDELIIKLEKENEKGEVKVESTPKNTNKSNEILKREGIVLNLPSKSKEEAIKEVAETLTKLGYVADGYNKYMQDREKLTTTYIGSYIAIPHGTVEGKSEVLNAGIVIHQYPEGIKFGDEVAYFLIGIAGKNDEHVEIISKIADVAEEEDDILALKDVKDIEKIYNAFSM